MQIKYDVTTILHLLLFSVEGHIFIIYINFWCLSSLYFTKGGFYLHSK